MYNRLKRRPKPSLTPSTMRSPAIDVAAVAELLDEDLEVFDTVPYRFDNKKQFVNFLQGAASGLASSAFGFRQLSCRVFNDIPGLPMPMTHLLG